ncbi:MAG: Uma2 family endonuclease [Chitinophagales bacterium]|jgi:Uma2 family endonuclease|nr:Uma2 family endonuclease [Sphingobacteriales bacterium]
MNITKLSQLDLNKKYSYADYLLWKIKERVELFKGMIAEMSPAPSTTHQRILLILTRIFDAYFINHSCSLFFAPVDVRLLNKKQSTKDKDIYNVVQPDLIVVCDEDKIDERGCLGAPDLVVEILSPGNSNKEMNIKYELYEEAGVKEYWMIHPTERQLLIYVLENGIFIGKKPIIESENAISYLFPKLKFPLKKLFVGVK